jgi:DNA-binding XRE family transcriptional regulator
MTAAEYKAEREWLGLTQTEIANRLGVSRDTIAKREAGRPINKEAVLAIKALGKR